MSINEARKKEFKFWRAKPVVKITEMSKTMRSKQIKTQEQILEKYATADELRLPADYRWDFIMIDDDRIGEICTFLTNNYRSDYNSSIDIDKLRWETMGRGFFVCIRKNNTMDIVGCIGMTPRMLQINSDIRTVAESIYLCCETSVRTSGMANVMINELIRRTSPEYDVGVCCTDRVIPSPIATIRYYTRPLNYKHLKVNEFINLTDIDDDAAHDRIKIKLRPPKTIYFAEKTRENIEIVFKLHNEYVKSLNLHNVLSIEEIENYFFDIRYVHTIFYENDAGKVVDFLCYRYYTIINTNRKTSPDDEYNNEIKSANIFMYSSNYIRPDILIINAFKICAMEKRHLLYIPDTMGSNEAILSTIKRADEDTDDEEENALFDQHMVKSRKKQFINLFNWEAPPMTQEMISFLIFN